jgi:hypothetical protein
MWREKQTCTSTPSCSLSFTLIVYVAGHFDIMTEENVTTDNKFLLCVDVRPCRFGAQCNIFGQPNRHMDRQRNNYHQSVTAICSHLQTGHWSVHSTIDPVSVLNVKRRYSFHTQKDTLTKRKEGRQTGKRIVTSTHAYTCNNFCVPVN